MLRGGLALLLLVGVLLLAEGARRRLGPRALTVEGLSLLALGVLLGPGATGLLPADLAVALHPVTLLALAWIGLLFGLQIDLRVIRVLRPWHVASGLLLPLAPGAAAAVALATAGAPTAVAVAVGALAAVASPRPLDHLLRRAAPMDRSAVRLLRVVMAFSGIPALVAFSIAAGAPGGWRGPVLAALVGVVAGYTALVLAGPLRTEIELVTVLLAVMALAAGVAAALGRTPLLPAAVAGTVLVNRIPFPHRLLRVASSVEWPLWAALLVLVGASWRPEAFAWGAFVALTGVRAGAWLAAGGLLAAVASRRGVPVRTRALGLGFLPMGPLAVGLLVAGVERGVVGPGQLEAAVAAVVCNHLAGRWWAGRRLAGGAR